MDWLHTLAVMDNALREREREVEQAARLARLFRDMPRTKPQGVSAAREWLRRAVGQRSAPPVEQPCCPAAA